MDTFWVLQSSFNINIRNDIFEILEEMTHVEGNCYAAVRFCDGAIAGAMLCSFFLYIASFSNGSGKSFSCISITGPNWVQLLKLNHATFVDMMGWWDTLSGRGITYNSMSPVTKLENCLVFPFPLQNGSHHYSNQQIFDWDQLPTQGIVCMVWGSSYRSHMVQISMLMMSFYLFPACIFLLYTFRTLNCAFLRKVPRVSSYIKRRKMFLCE